MKSLCLIAAEHLLLLDQCQESQMCRRAGVRLAPTTSEAAGGAEGWAVFNPRTPCAGAGPWRQLIQQAVLHIRHAHLAQTRS